MITTQIHYAKPRIHVGDDETMKVLHAAFPQHARGEILDALQTAQYDVSLAREYCQMAASQNVCLSVYLAQLEETGNGR